MVANDDVLTIANNNLADTGIAVASVAAMTAPTTTDCIQASYVPRLGGTRNAEKCFLLS